ncbi:ankyrin repeat domain-containing protein [Histoplasma ohiense]|nr:ankyrin repeat domain-containing protein [Histoplasma ohiense (nom. inval.)]
MAEGLAAAGAVSSIVQLFDFAAKFSTRLYKFLGDSNDSPKTFHEIQVLLPVFLGRLQHTQILLDQGSYSPPMTVALQSLVDEYTAHMLELDYMLERSTPRKDNSIITRSRKAVYGVMHEKQIIALKSKLSECYQTLSLCQLDVFAHQMDKLRDDHLLPGSSRLITYSSGNEKTQNQMDDDKIVRRQNKASPYSQKIRQYSASINLSRFFLPWAVSMSLDLSWGPQRYTLCPSLRFQGLVKRTSPGFTVFWKCDNHYMELSKGVELLKRLFQEGRASPYDADPDGKSWAEVLLDFRGVGNFEVRREFLKVLNESGAQINASLPIRSIGYPQENSVLPYSGDPATNLHIGDIDDAINFMKILLDNPEKREWGSYLRYYDLFYLKLLQKCAEHSSGSWNQTPLMDAVLAGTAAELDTCIKRRIPLDAKNSLGQAAIHMAVLRPCQLLRLIEAGAEVEIKDGNGATPLCHAISYGSVESTKLLLEYGTIPLSTDESENPLSICLHHAFSAEHWDVLRLFFSHIRTVLDFPEKAVEGLANSYVAKWLENPTRFPFPPPPGMSILLQLGVSPDVTSNSGITLLHCAGTEQEVRALFEAGFTKTNQLNDKGYSPLMNALDFRCRSDSTAYRAIIAQGVDVNLQNNRGTSAMHIICENIGSPYPKYTDDSENLKFLSVKLEAMAMCLSRGADPFARDQCRCPCSVNGCSPGSMLLRRLYGDDWRGHLIALEWLLMLKEYQGKEAAEAALADLVRAANFAMMGMKHICCGGYGNSHGPYFDQNEINEILVEQKDNIRILEESMLSFARRPDQPIEESWLFVLSILDPSTYGTIAEPWSVGTWEHSYMQTFIPQKTAPWKSHAELLNDWTYENYTGFPSYSSVDESRDEFRVAIQRVAMNIPRSKLYSLWVEYIYQNQNEFGFPKPLDDTWLKTRRYWGARQAKTIEAVVQDREGDRIEVLG